MRSLPTDNAFAASACAICELILQDLNSIDLRVRHDDRPLAAVTHDRLNAGASFDPPPVRQHVPDKNEDFAGKDQPVDRSTSSGAAGPIRRSAFAS